MLGLDKASIKSSDILPHDIYGNSNLLYNTKFLILGSLMQQRSHPWMNQATSSCRGAYENHGYEYSLNTIHYGQWVECQGG